MTLRQGNSSEVYGNLFLGSAQKKDMGGVRIYGSGHRVYCNYFEGLTAAKNKVSAITIDSGSPEGGSSASHSRATLCDVVNNTIIRCASGIALGPGYEEAPSDCRIANNLIYGTREALHEAIPCDGILYEDNIVFPAGTTGPIGESGVLSLDPRLQESGNSYTFGEDSPAWGASRGGYPYITVDFHGRTIPGKRDIGCMEVSQ